MEEHYHHLFTNDKSILDLAKEINYPTVIKRPHTNWYVNGKIYEFDSILAALRFPPLPIIDRIRNLFTLGLLRLNPFWHPLEKVNAHKLLPLLMGKKAYQMLWEPLFINKFGQYAANVSLAWYWARIKKRTQFLAYPKGGFLHFIEAIVAKIRDQGGKVLLENEVISVSDDKKVIINVKNNRGDVIEYNFDKAIVTLPAFQFMKIAQQLPQVYKDKLLKLKGIGAINLVLRLDKPFFHDDTYWLSVADKSSPIMAIVEHTNYMDKKYYNNEHLVYLGNYLSPDHPNFSKSKEDLLALYDPFLKKINPNYHDSIIDYKVFKVPFGQPIVQTNYSKLIPPYVTPLKNIFLANIEQVYPWDRGTNYAVELGEKIVKKII